MKKLLAAIVLGFVALAGLETAEANPPHYYYSQPRVYVAPPSYYPYAYPTYPYAYPYYTYPSYPTYPAYPYYYRPGVNFQLYLR